MIELFGFPPETGAGFVTGATMANLSALAAARNRIYQHAGWNVEADGLFGAPPITVVAGDEAHPTLLKSLGLLGLGRNRVTRVPVDDQGRMRADRFPSVDARTIVCLQAGNVNTGAFDPLAELCARARDGGAWVHVDGAFGLWAKASPALAHLAAGIELADSWATDAHKWLNVPADSGIAFSRDAAALRAAMSVSAEYLPKDSVNRDPSEFTPELSRRARGIEVWTALRCLGREGLAELFERNCRGARMFAQRLSAAGYRILNDVVLNQVLVSFGSSRNDSAGDQGHPAGWNVLVRRHGMAETDRHAHQHLLLGDDRRRCRKERRRDDSRRAAVWSRASRADQSRYAGNFGSERKSSGSCCTMKRALVLRTIVSMRLIDASVSARLALNPGTRVNSRLARV